MGCTGQTGGSDIVAHAWLPRTHGGLEIRTCNGSFHVTLTIYRPILNLWRLYLIDIYYRSVY